MLPNFPEVITCEYVCPIVIESETVRDPETCACADATRPDTLTEKEADTLVLRVEEEVTETVIVPPGPSLNVVPGATIRVDELAVIVYQGSAGQEYGTTPPLALAVLALATAGIASGPAAATTIAATTVLIRMARSFRFVVPLGT